VRPSIPKTVVDMGLITHSPSSSYDARDLLQSSGLPQQRVLDRLLD
jgi:hypothetical protein